MVHPECTPEVIDLSDRALSTGGMLKWAKESDSKEFIVGTEVDMIYRLSKDNSGKKFYPATKKAVCKNMKKTTLEKILWSLEDMKERIEVNSDVQQKAKVAIQRMLEISG